MQNRRCHADGISGLGDIVHSDDVGAMANRHRTAGDGAGEALLGRAPQQLAKHGIGCIVIVGDDDKVAGIVSERDVVRAIAHMGSDILNGSVSQIMTDNVVTCSRKDTVDSLMTIMTQRRFRHLPVVDDGSLGGIISIGDVVQQRIAEAELEASAMREYIATG